MPILFGTIKTCDSQKTEIFCGKSTRQHLNIKPNDITKIALEQKSAKLQGWQAELLNPNLAEFARSCGTVGILADDSETFDRKVAVFFSVEGSTILHVKCRLWVYRETKKFSSDYQIISISNLKRFISVE